MSSNHIFVSFLNLCRSAEANPAVKPVIHQTETLIAGSLERIIGPPAVIIDEMLSLMA
jgi:hypothetical protein